MKIKILLISCLWLLGFQMAFSQTHDGPYVVTSQADIDNFNYTTIDGNLIINNVADLTSIDGFATLTTINGKLEIKNNLNLITISGFNALQTIETSFVIENNTQLQTIDEFSSLVDVGRYFTIQNCGKLTTIQGFNNLLTVGTYVSSPSQGTDRFQIIGNADLETIEGFEDLNEIAGHFYLNNNDKLENINAFQNLESVEANFTINNNSTLPLLTNYFQNLSEVGLDMFIRANDDLTAIDGFPSLESVGRNFNINQNNLNLLTINGFNALETVGSSFVIEDNPKLQTIDDFDSLIDVGRYFTIKNCIKLTTIQGFNNLSTVGTYVSSPSQGTDRFQIIDNSDLETIEGFEDLNEIAGHFYLNNNDKLENINAFQNLESVEANFTINNNSTLPLLTNYFQNLSEVGLDMFIRANDDLTAIDGFPSLESVGRNFNINQNNLNLLTINGFNTLETVGSSFVIEGNPQLQTIGSFTSLSDVNRYFTINNCEELREITGFGSLSTIGTYVSSPSQGTDRFQIVNNPDLESVEGFCSLETITGDFRIENNSNLTIAESLFKNLEDIERNFILTNNTNFNDCCILSCIDVENITDNQVTINSNGGDCSSMEDINMNCGQIDCEMFCIEDVDVCCVCDGVGAATWYLDSDGDGFGNSNISVISCEQPIGYVDNGDDPDDTCAGQVDDCGVCEGPGIPEGTCDCDGTPENIWYADTDMDGLGDPNNTIQNCDDTPPTGYVDNGDDDDDSVPVSIEDAQFERQIILFPNPTTALITIQHPQNGTPTQIHLVDLNGRHLTTTQSTTGETQHDLSTLPDGIYFVHLVNEDYNAVRKILKSGR